MTHEATVRVVLRQLMPAWVSYPLAGVEYLPGGYTNRNYRIEVDGNAYVLRIAQGNSPRPTERRYLDIPAAPDVVAYDARRGHLLTRWIEGRILAESPPTPEEAGQYLADLHGQIPTGLGTYDYRAEISAMFRQAASVDPQVLACFEDDHWVPRERRGCHNDLNPWNIVRVESGPAPNAFRTLDWESAGDNDPLFDVVGLCLGLGWGIDEATDGIAAYAMAGRTIAATTSRLRQTFRAFLVREYAWAVAQVAIGNSRDEVRNQAIQSRDGLAEWR